MSPNPIFEEPSAPDVSIVIPCLNQARALPFAIANARAALVGLDRELGLTGEIILADAGSRDGSQMIAMAEGSRVVDVPGSGYGAALNSGLAAAQGRYLVMGDLDGSCDFRDCVPMVRALMRGVDLCVGSRKLPKQHSGLSRLFNPLLSLFLRWFFGVVVSDATCRLRAVSAMSFQALRLQATGIEYTTEMIIKAALLGHRISESPSHVRGRKKKGRRGQGQMMRHLGYVLMLSPAWVFLVPAFLLGLAAAALWAGSVMRLGQVLPQLPGGGYVAAGALLSLAHMFVLFALGAHLYACREGFRAPARGNGWLRASLTTSGQLCFAAGLAAAGCLLLSLPMVLEVQFLGLIVLGVSLIVLSLQSAFAAFLVAILQRAEVEEGRRQLAPHPMPQPIRLGL